MLRGVIPFEALDQPPGFGGWKGFVEGRLAVDVEIVLDQHDGPGGREVEIGQVFQDVSIIHGGVAVDDFEFRFLFRTMVSKVMMSALHAEQHGTGRKEEQRLEEGMRDKVEHSRREGTHANPRHHESQLADGGICQHFLDVELADRDRGGEKGGYAPQPSPQ